MADLLDMGYINSLPQPLWARSGSWWPVHDIDVQTGLLRIDACGMLDVMHISDVLTFRDDSGKEHCAHDFYVDAEREQDEGCTASGRAQRTNNNKED